MSWKHIVAVMILATVCFGEPMSLDKAYKLVYSKTSETLFNTLWKDINGDGQNDLLIGVACNADEECLYYTFLKGPKGFEEVGTILLQRTRFKVLEKKSGGLNELLYYCRKGEKGGYLLLYRFNGQQFDVDSTYYSSDEQYEKATSIIENH